MLTTVPHIRAGKLRALGVTSSSRASALPQQPTIAEAGVPGYEVDVWFGVFVPKKTPKTVILILNTEIAKIMNNPGVKASLENQGFEARTNTPEELAKMIQSETVKWAKVVKESSAKVDYYHCKRTRKSGSGLSTARRQPSLSATRRSRPTSCATHRTFSRRLEFRPPLRRY